MSTEAGTLGLILLGLAGSFAVALFLNWITAVPSELKSDFDSIKERNER